MRPSPLIVAVTALSLACGQGRELAPDVPGVAIGLSLGGADASVDGDEHARELAYLHALIERSRQAAAPDASAVPGRPRNFDPLGRTPPSSGTAGNDEFGRELPKAGDLLRSREILEELRRRAGEAERPTIERDYIDRLLRRF